MNTYKVRIAIEQLLAAGKGGASHPALDAAAKDALSELDNVNIQIRTIELLKDRADAVLENAGYPERTKTQASRIEDLRRRAVAAEAALAEARKLSPLCIRCGSPLERGRCIDETCPFSDHEQDCPRGWIGHPEHAAGEFTPCKCRKETP